MEQILAFILANKILWLVFLVLLLVYIGFELRHRGAGGRRVAPSDAVKLINQQHAIIVDMRDNAAFQQGHIINALNITPGQLEGREKELKKKADKPLIVVCQHGQQAPALAKQLKTRGFTEVYLLSGGMSAWQNAGLPTTTR